MQRPVGLVLAGGAGRRLGRPKGNLVVAGTTFAQRAASALWPYCSTVLVSVTPGGRNPVPECAAVEDAPPAGRGPLAGLDAAFCATATADLLVLACDYPRIDAALVRRLVTFAADDEDDVVLLTDAGGRDHPLVAIWKRRTHAVIRDALERSAYKVRSLLPDLAVRRLGPEAFPGVDLDAALFNVNWPADLERLEGPG